MSKEISCNGCKALFSSKNALFKHLRASGGKCFSKEEYLDFLRFVVNSDKNKEKIIILYGYQISYDCMSKGLSSFGGKIDPCEEETKENGVRDGNHAAQLVLDAMETVAFDGEVDETNKTKKINDRVNRSYGHFGRASEICLQDEFTGATMEVLTTRAPPLLVLDCPKSEQKEKEEESLQKWISQVNGALEKIIQDFTTENNVKFPGKVKVFGRLPAPKKFNAEMDVNHRRVDYVIPADLLFNDTLDMTRENFLRSLQSFQPGNNTVRKEEPSEKTGLERVAYLHILKLKKIMQRMCTQVVELDVTNETAVLEKEFHRQKRLKYGKGINNNPKPNESKTQPQKNSEAKGDEEIVVKKKKKGGPQRMLQRKRYHNFTPTVMAHEFLSYRRLDRFFHRATVRMESDVTNTAELQKRRPYVVLSLKGDLFLHGQVRALIGLFVAIVRGYIDADFIDCVFDEEYTHLVPCPFAPATGLFAGEANYASWEGKMNAILTPRQCDRYKKGWNSEAIFSSIDDFQDEMFNGIIRAWEQGEQHSLEKDLPCVSTWLNDYLEPWSKRAKEQLNDYRAWKAAKDQVAESDDPQSSLIDLLVPPVSTVCSEVPTLYEKVLSLLREADTCGAWPTTTPKRQLVMVSTSENAEDEKNNSLAIARMKAKTNDFENASAYSFKEGQGGASGSFSVGAMPGQGCEPPKANSLFPELMKAAFELEIALCPDREPSSTIAINRNAQFRPHIDSGAGAGQSTSLIVGLGTYSGGELIVEGKKECIRYRPLEFNGWTQRHWTMPFKGERFSLVWFTPKGCEGVHGIDLTK